jgi:hypothetical protein
LFFPDRFGVDIPPIFWLIWSFLPLIVLAVTVWWFISTEKHGGAAWIELVAFVVFVVWMMFIIAGSVVFGATTISYRHW